MYTPKWFAEKAREYPELDAEAQENLTDFQTKFSPAILSSLTGKDILNTIFLNGDNSENLCRVMEYDAKNRELFGSIAGGNAHKYGLFFSSEGCWMTGTGRNPQKITEEEAIEIGTKMRDYLLAGVKAIEEYGKIETIDDYKSLHSTLKEVTAGHVERAWFMKYFYMLFPDLLASDYSDAAQRTVLSAIGIEQETYPFVRMGQIKLFTDKCGISNVMFNKVFWENFSAATSTALVSPTHSSTPVCAEPVRDDLSVDELGEILAKMYNSASNKPAGIHMFGIKYGKVIEENNYAITSIVTASGLPASYKEEVRKGIKIYDSIFNNEFGICFTDESVAVTEPKNCEEKCNESFALLKLPNNTRRTHPFNQILYGAPGTGKTYATAQYALSIIEDTPIAKISKEPRKDIMSRYNGFIESERIVFTTFHQNYGYEDFIQGIRPDTTKGGMNFKTVDGVFKKISWQAMQNPEKDYVIIIDEINRANISKVFGELITLIEDDKRWGEENAVSVTLPSGEPFAVPNNLYILGTMNSADKSISLIDTALRRRFKFVEFEPDLSLITDVKLRTVLEKLNNGISEELHSTDLLVGHSYFINKTTDDICDIMNHSIIPLLYEYFFDKSNKVEAHLKASLEELDIEILSGSMGRIKIKKKDEQ
ncbi:MAG: AAA family ATPase [Ruminococcaceae bacterium]|nr:AAA family ATPase [Oscillospiraceae bacterium]